MFWGLSHFTCKQRSQNTQKSEGENLPREQILKQKKDRKRESRNKNPKPKLFSSSLAAPLYQSPPLELLVLGLLAPSAPSPSPANQIFSFPLAKPKRLSPLHFHPHTKIVPVSSSSPLHLYLPLPGHRSSFSHSDTHKNHKLQPFPASNTAVTSLSLPLRC